MLRQSPKQARHEPNTHRPSVVFDPNLTNADRLVLESLSSDVRSHAGGQRLSQLSSASGLRANYFGDADTDASGKVMPTLFFFQFSPCAKSLLYTVSCGHLGEKHLEEAAIAAMAAANDPKDALFEPTVFSGFDLDKIRLPRLLHAWFLDSYIRRARSMVHVETDVVMVTHLLLYFCTSVPSAALLFCRLTWIHGLLHFAMQVSYMGTYTLMMHQHIHVGSILEKRFVLVDTLFPYITDPLMGHTWNSYFYHHVKHHHVEGNGPKDLSSTVRDQRDSVLHFLHYAARFFFLVWLDLPLYFAKAAFWELGWYAVLNILYRCNPNATLVVFLLPLLLLRAGLMLGNWGQHAYVDQDEPDSDYRSSITLIDVPVRAYHPFLRLSKKDPADQNRATVIASMTATTPRTT